jgi:endonuclease YncB( thermonuclease family)
MDGHCQLFGSSGCCSVGKAREYKFSYVGGEKKTSNVKAIRSTIESSFLNREVTLEVTGLEEGLQGYFTLGDDDIRKVLLRNGYAKLAKDAMSGISTKEFMELKMIAQQALQEGKGLWKEQKVTKSETLNSKSYTATVCEVHSGDNITVCTEKG